MDTKDAKIAKDMPFSDYLSVKAMSASVLKKLSASYRDYRLSIFTGKKNIMREGHLTHLVILEPDKFEEQVYQLDDGVTRRHKEYKELASVYGEEMVLPSGEYNSYISIASEVRKNPSAVKYLGGCHEVSAFWDDPDFGPAKARFDVLGEDFVADLKTVAAGAFMRFGYHSDRFGYDIQAAWYLRGAKALGLDISKFVFVLVEKGNDMPDSSVQIAPVHMIESGEAKIAQALANKNEGDTAGDTAFLGKLPGVSFVDFPLYNNI